MCGGEEYGFQCILLIDYMVKIIITVLLLLTIWLKSYNIATVNYIANIAYSVNYMVNIAYSIWLITL